MIFKPCFTKALLTWSIFTRSHIVPRATKSKYKIKLGTLSLKNCISFSLLFNEVRRKKVTPAAHKLTKSESSSFLFGFTIANALGSNSDCLWWSITITSTPFLFKKSISLNAVVPQSSVIISSQLFSTNFWNASIFGP